MKQARIILLEKCNMSCSYCLMENPSIRNNLGEVPATMDEILEKKYSTYCLTGGEIFTNKPLLYKVIKQIRDRDMEADIFLYSNGSLVDSTDIKRLRYVVQGFNWGLHGGFTPTIQERMIELHQSVPVRILRLDIYRDLHKIRRFAKEHGMTYRVIAKDQCETVPEDKYLLKSD